jgi:hypothetical protein
MGEPAKGRSRLMAIVQQAPARIMNSIIPERSLKQPPEEKHRHMEFETRLFGLFQKLSLVAAFICGVLGIFYFLAAFSIPSLGADPWNDLGNLGSFLQGTTGSLWALAGVFLIFVAFLAQKRQLSLQQFQFERQSFENSFFQLINLQNQIVMSLRYRHPSGGFNLNEPETQGRDCFEKWYLELKNGFVEAQNNGQSYHVYGTPLRNLDVEEIAGVYFSFYVKHQSVIGHYFRNLYNVFEFVASAEIPEHEKGKYISIASAQLSQFELTLLFYNAITPLPSDTDNKFKSLIERFGLFEDLNQALLLHPKRDNMPYHSSAFIVRGVATREQSL